MGKEAHVSGKAKRRAQRRRKGKGEGPNAATGSKKKTESIFDNILKSELEHMPQLSSPLINEIFDSRHPEDAPVVAYGTEHINVWGKTYSDATLRIGGVLYHLECQSATDSMMVLRMLEYDLALALSNMTQTGSIPTATLPKSCVLYLRHTKNTPSALLAMLTGLGLRSLVYKSKVVKVQRYSLDDIFEKRLLVLFPFFLMRYNDNKLARIAQDTSLADELIMECENALARLKTETLDKGDETLYHSLISYTVQVVEHLFVKHEELMKRVRETMGGHYIETHEEMVARLTAENAASEAEIAGIKAERDDIAAKLDAKEAELGSMRDTMAELLAMIAGPLTKHFESNPEDAARLLSHLPPGSLPNQASGPMISGT